ncbi:MAG: hypothetical protein WCR96_01475 [Candidatus Methanomethylophilaceae archaeon]
MFVFTLMILSFLAYGIIFCGIIRVAAPVVKDVQQSGLKGVVDKIWYGEVGNTNR